MDLATFWQKMASALANRDLLCHPFYKAWTAGELSREDLRAYARAYYPHVAAFPEYLETLAPRILDEQSRTAVLVNKEDELGIGSADDRSHADLWLDFAEGMGADHDEVFSARLLPEVEALVNHFRSVAREGSLAEALAAFYAYESQVPRVAKEKATGLAGLYQADAKTCRYFTLHTTADVYHSQVWRELLDRELKDREDGSAERALCEADRAAAALWTALDGMERERQARAAALLS